VELQAAVALEILLENIPVPFPCHLFFKDHDAHPASYGEDAGGTVPTSSSAQLSLCSCIHLFPAQNQRTVESLRLEESSKIPKPNLSPPPPCPLTTSCSATSQTPAGTVTPPPPWASCATASLLSEKKLFLISNLNLLWHNMKPSPLILLALHGSRG